MSEGSISRRSALRGGAIAIVGALAGYFVARNSEVDHPAKGSGGANGYAAPSGGGKFLAYASQVPIGGGLILSGPAVVVIRESDDSYRAFSAICTHQGCTVASVENGAIICPCHGSHFSARDGAVLQGPATRPLPTVKIAERSGLIYTA